MVLVKRNIKWKDVLGFEGVYQVNNIGQVYSCHTTKILNAYKSNDGYVSKVCKRIKYTAAGYVWRYKDDPKCD